jgi:hypothetical protein
MLEEMQFQEEKVEAARVLIAPGTLGPLTRFLGVQTLGAVVAGEAGLVALPVAREALGLF